MQVTDITRSKRLYELSGWDSSVYIMGVPAYGIDLLLDKLYSQDLDDNYMSLSVCHHDSSRSWRAVFGHYLQYADTPINALADLCIALFKEGILKKGDV